MAKDRLTFCIFGAGRIGKLHARNIAAHPRARIKYVVDPVARAAAVLARQVGARTSPDATTALADREIDAVVIASSTNTHVDLIMASARMGKAVLCEKPIDLDIKRVDRCLAALEKHRVPVAIGFNRRFDPTNRAIRAAIRNGDVGDVEMIVITSRDPEPPPAAYIKVSGGLFRDMMIHDFDLARWLLGEEPVEVVAKASCRVDRGIGRAGDVDTAMVILTTRRGSLCHINNSRRAAYGYDQRIEVFGSRGMVRSDNLRPTAVLKSNAVTTDARDPLLHFFVERYADAYLH
ncbi:inositol 2-dehydrogenase [Vineibacter terrae]|uniref:inositol 2-dehydrogenase n=1 Tax=Vineibacter terrae TaxID=2586908 RepID=UPI0038B5189E